MYSNMVFDNKQSVRKLYWMSSHEEVSTDHSGRLIKMKRKGIYRPTVEDAIEIGGIETLHPGGFAG